MHGCSCADNPDSASGVSGADIHQQQAINTSSSSSCGSKRYTNTTIPHRRKSLADANEETLVEMTGTEAPRVKQRNGSDNNNNYNNDNNHHNSKTANNCNTETTAQLKMKTGM